MLADMGNREDLLAGAKTCLLDKGFTRTTIRDIGAAAGVSTAAIGYHFGSKEALLAEAFVQLQMEWGNKMEAAMDLPAEADPATRFAALWTKVIESFADSRRLWTITLEVLADTGQRSKLRELLLARQPEARNGLSEMIGQVLAVDADPVMVARFYEALLTGLMFQSIAYPDEHPDGAELVTTMRAVVAAFDRG